jgi:hypothetical protein
MSCYQLIYTSRPKVEVTESLVSDILSKAIRRNNSLKISGMLIYFHGMFMQLIEGDKEAVDELFNIIRLDPRHGDITVLLQKQSDERCMPTWIMGFTMDNEFGAQIEEQSFCIPCDEAKEFCSMMPVEVGKLFLDFMKDVQVKNMGQI